jgi:CheY-like chemotaxis protein
MSDLITDILDVASIESGSLRLDRKPQPLAPLVRRAAGINAVLSSRKGIAIDVELDEGDAHCLIDARKIDQVLNNLLGNAVKFSHAGTRIRISMATDESRVTVSVEDQGQGIPEGELDRIFTPFEKGSSRTTAGEPSTGLGLSIVKRIVTGHGGTIQVKSTVGVGSTFSFTLPRIAPPRPAEAPSAGSPAEGSARPARVLFVDDNALNQKVGKLMLARVGAEAAFASDGREALALVERERFDLVLMDCHMPDVDGYGATAAIRSMERATGRRRLPIIAMPASATEGARSRCLAAGMDDVLEKPFGQEQLAEVLRRWVQERAGE